MSTETRMTTKSNTTAKHSHQLTSTSHEFSAGVCISRPVLEVPKSELDADFSDVHVRLELPAI